MMGQRIVVCLVSTTLLAGVSPVWADDGILPADPAEPAEPAAAPPTAVVETPSTDEGSNPWMPVVITTGAVAAGLLAFSLVSYTQMSAEADDIMATKPSG